MSVLTHRRVPQAATCCSSVVETIVEATVDSCRRAFGQRLAHIILTGSLARNEATVLAGSDGWRILGDAELLLVFYRRFALPGQNEIEALNEDISNRLRCQAVTCPVHLAAVHPRYLRRLPRHIFSYELRTKGRVIYGDPEILRHVPQFPPETLEREDAWRMLSNRLIEWLENLARVPDGREEPNLELFYSSMKLCLDAATSLLVFLDGYEPTYCDRAERLKALAANHSTTPSVPIPLATFAATVETATRWKLSPDPAMTKQGGWSFCFAARDCATQLWSWELAQISGVHQGLPPLELIRQWGRKLGFARRWRGWLYAFRETGWCRNWREWLRWRSLARHGSPRHWIYALAAECNSRGEIFSPGRMPAAFGLVLPKFRPFLPVAWPQGKCSQDDWRALVLDLAWNYHQFVERTRA